MNCTFKFQEGPAVTPIFSQFEQGRNSGWKIKKIVTGSKFWKYFSLRINLFEYHFFIVYHQLLFPDFPSDSWRSFQASKNISQSPFDVSVFNKMPLKIFSCRENKKIVAKCIFLFKSNAILNFSHNKVNFPVCYLQMHPFNSISRFRLIPFSKCLIHCLHLTVSDFRKTLSTDFIENVFHRTWFEELKKKCLSITAKTIIFIQCGCWVNQTQKSTYMFKV